MIWDVRTSTPYCTSYVLGPRSDPWLIDWWTVATRFQDRSRMNSEVWVVDSLSNNHSFIRSFPKTRQDTQADNFFDEHEFGGYR
ncbi:hypothetical protein EAF00_006699 [Botryotinia globosa]|nr:hypothetical protein EAF00_006699 [Botryotinia globosa]